MTGDLALLTRPGCGGTLSMRTRLDAALASLGLPPAYAVVDVSTLGDDDARRGYPTPTVLLDGHDLFGLAPPSPGQAPT